MQNVTALMHNLVHDDNDDHQEPLRNDARALCVG